MKLYTYLNYGGNCRQAFEFYVEHLGGKITEITTHGAVSNDVPDDWKNAVVHARMELGDTMLLGGHTTRPFSAHAQRLSDADPGQQH